MQALSEGTLRGFRWLVDKGVSDGRCRGLEAMVVLDVRAGVCARGWWFRWLGCESIARLVQIVGDRIRVQGCALEVGC